MDMHHVNSFFVGGGGEYYERQIFLKIQKKHKYTHCNYNCMENDKETEK